MMFKWIYDDGQNRFEGTAKFYSGFNPIKLTSSKGFVNAFHKAYPGRSIKDIAIDISFIKAERI